MILRGAKYEASLLEGILRSKEDTYNIDNYATKISFPLNDEDVIIFTNYEILKKYENILLENSVWMELKEKHQYRPEYLSKMLYDNINLWYLILFLNKCENCYEFDRKNIRVIHPDNIGILTEIYNTEKNYIKNISVDTNNLQLKSLYAKSDNITKFPNFSIGNPGDIDQPTEDGNIGNFEYSPIQYNLSRHYLQIPIDNVRPDGLIYSANSVTGTVLSKNEQIIGLKPMYVGGTAKVFINNQLMFESPSNNSDVSVLKRKYLNSMQYVLDNKYEFVEGVNWYNSHINAMLVRIKSEDFQYLPIEKEVRIKLTFEGGTTAYYRNIYTRDEVTFPVDISSNYGKLETVSISVLGDLTRTENNNPVYSDIKVAYFPCEYKYSNILLSKNECYNIRMEVTNMQEFYPMISYSFKDYKMIDKEDLVEQTGYDNLNLLPTTNSPANIIINNSTVFKGLQLISLIDSRELDGSERNENHLEDITGRDLNDSNEKLLLYEQVNTKNVHISDYFVSGSLFCRNNISKINGSMGIFVKGKSESGKVSAYVYMMKMKNEFTDKNKSLLHGLYKLEIDAENIDLDSDGLNYSNLKKISDTSQYISGNMENDTFFKIVTYKNNIKIYDGNSSRPIIDYFDSEEIIFDKTEQPMFGLAMYNVRNPGYKNMVVMGRDYNE